MIFQPCWALYASASPRRAAIWEVQLQPDDGNWKRKNESSELGIFGVTAPSLNKEEADGFKKGPASRRRGVACESDSFRVNITVEPSPKCSTPFATDDWHRCKLCTTQWVLDNKSRY